MPLTLAQMLALLPDNTAGDISAADMRDVVAAIARGQRAPHSVDDADDVWWESDIGDFTTVTVTGTQTVTEKDGFLSVKYSGQSGGDHNGVLKAHTFSIGDSFATRIRLFGPAGQVSFGGLVFTDGTTSAANAIQVSGYVDAANNTLVDTLHGTLTAMGSEGFSITARNAFPWLDGLYVRLTYTASNSFTAHFSPDGATWSVLGQSAVSKTITPTHFGVTWSKEGGSVESVVSFGPICKLA